MHEGQCNGYREVRTCTIRRPTAYSFMQSPTDAQIPRVLPVVPGLVLANRGDLEAFVIDGEVPVPVLNDDGHFVGIAFEQVPRDIDTRRLGAE